MKYFSGRQRNAPQRTIGKPMAHFLASALMVSTIIYGCKREITQPFAKLTQSELFQAGSKIAKNRKKNMENA